MEMGHDQEDGYWRVLVIGSNTAQVTLLVCPRKDIRHSSMWTERKAASLFDILNRVAVRSGGVLPAFVSYSSLKLSLVDYHLFLEKYMSLPPARELLMEISYCY